VAGRVARAQAIWREGRDPRGTPAEAYLSRRGLALPEELAGRVLRYHPALWCEAERQSVLGMLAAYRPISGDRDPDAPPCAIQRWFLTGTGEARRGPDGHRLKLMLGPTAVAAIKLTPDEAIEQGLCVAEGLETSLSLYLHGWRPMWALGSAGAIRSLPVLSGVEALNIFADHDAAGLEAARTCRDRWRAAGRHCLVIRRKAAGLDWADPFAEAAP
jgi:hypothetical protein